MHRQKGFSLVEVAIAVLIGSLILGAMLSMFSAQLTNARINSTKTKEDAIKTALVNFIARNNRLPCPAQANLAQGNANYGVEAANPNVCTNTTLIGTGANINARGIIPWKTLGLSDDAALDGYKRRFTYQVKRTETARTATTITGMGGNINVWEDAAGGIALNPNDPAAAIIVSHGENGLGAFLPFTGSRIGVAPNGTFEGENSDNDMDFIQRAYSENQTNPYDDIVMWLTPTELLTEVRLGGALLSAQGEVNKRFEAIKNALVSYIAADNVDPDGAGPRMRWRRLPYADRTDNTCIGTLNNGDADTNCLIGNAPWLSLFLPQAYVTDPWGNYIRYSVDAVPASDSIASDGLTTTTPAAGNAAFSLTASGNDGVLGTADDILMSVTVTELRGLLISSGISLD